MIVSATFAVKFTLMKQLAIFVEGLRCVIISTVQAGLALSS